MGSVILDFSIDENKKPLATRFRMNSTLLEKRNLACNIILGTIYAALIMPIDREIVSAEDKHAAIFRVPLAIVISLISVPVECKPLRLGCHIVVYAFRVSPLYHENVFATI